MSTLAKTKRRINSVKNTRKITNAMELVASVKLKRFRDLMTEEKHYVDNIKDVMTRLSSIIKNEKEVDTIKKENSRLFIIINSNLGLCAHYNIDIFNFAKNILNPDDEIIPIGLKGYTHYKNEDFILNKKFVSLNENLNFDNVNNLAHFILSEYNLNKYSEVHIIYMEYINSLTSRPVVNKILPPQFDHLPNDLLPPIVEPNADILIKELEPIYVASVIYQAILISQVSEQSYRNTAMKNATDNADDLLDKLKLIYNKARQGAITQEIAEVVSGSSDLT